MPSSSNNGIAAAVVDLETLKLPTEGRLGYLTTIQEDNLKLLRLQLLQNEIFNPKRHNDCTLLRFLRARQFDVNRAFLMISEYEKWRKIINIEELCENFNFDKEIIDVRAIYPQFYHNVDKLGRPLYIERFSLFDVKKLKSIVTMEKMEQRLIVEYEKLINIRMPSCSLLVNKNIEQSCTILDLNGVSLWGFSSIAGFVQQISKIGQNYYPEVLGSMFIVNAPTLFTTIWAIIKKFLDEATVKKIHIVGSSYTKETLLAHIDSINLPKFLGGSCECLNNEGKSCCIESDIGPWLTETKENITKYQEKDLEELIKWSKDNNIIS